MSLAKETLLGSSWSLILSIGPDSFFIACLFLRPWLAAGCGWPLGSCEAKEAEETPPPSPTSSH
jgi:hypothetical protein